MIRENEVVATETVPLSLLLTGPNPIHLFSQDRIAIALLESDNTFEAHQVASSALEVSKQAEVEQVEQEIAKTEEKHITVERKEEPSTVEVPIQEVKTQAGVPKEHAKEVRAESKATHHTVAEEQHEAPPKETQTV